MSTKKHKGEHNLRAERRAAKAASAPIDPAKVKGSTRVYLRNPIYIWATLGVVVVAIALLVLFGMLGWWENLLGSILAIAVGIVGCTCLYDVALLLTACISFGEGMVNAGKDEGGQLMVFHASAVTRLELRDGTGATLPDDAPLYKNVDLTFVMQSGRVNRRRVSRLTAKQYSAVKAALEAARTWRAEE